MLSVRLLAVLTAALGLALATAANAAVSPLETVERLAKQATVTAFGQKVAWSRYDPAGRNYRLVVADLGQPDDPPTVLPIAARAVAFDVDLGPGPDGQTMAVYSRCAQEPDGDYYGQKLWPNNARGCDIYAFDFAAGQERKLKNLSSIHEDFLPTLWKGGVAFARSYGSYVDGEWRDSVLYTHSLAGSETSRRQSQGRTRRLERISLTGLDLYGQRLALTRRFLDRYDAGTTQMRVTTLGSGSRLLQQQNSGLTQRLLRSPQFHHGRVLWLEQCAADPGGCDRGNYRFWRSRITRHDVSFLDAPQWLTSSAFVLDSVWWVRAANGFGFDNDNACQDSEPPDPAARCRLQRAFVTFG